MIIRRILGPLALMTITPVSLLLLWYITCHCNGSFALFYSQTQENGIIHTIETLFYRATTNWEIALLTIACFSAFEIILLKLLPGKKYEGPMTPMGNVPVYKENGVLSFIVTTVAFVTGGMIGLYPLTIFYDILGPFLLLMTVLSFLFCVFLYIKGKIAPSTTDAHSSGNIIFDFYWGIELYPRIFGIDVKQFTNCRFGMMVWPLLILSYAAKQSELYGLSSTMVVSVALQLIYVGIFFVWESGYMKSLDIMHDRAGYYICWGCLSWVPGFYTLPTMFLVHHPLHLSTLLASILFTFGLVNLLINTSANLQRKRVRHTQGECRVFGKKPKLIEATYTTNTGETKTNMLLVSGWWGIARHFHYLPEILGALAWTIPFFPFVIPYLYITFLTILLVDRSVRDHKRCAEKYGEHWEEYCEMVPYKIIPYIY